MMSALVDYELQTSPAASLTYNIIIVSYNNRHDLSACLNSLQDAGCTGVIVVDNASQDGSADFVRRSYGDVQVIESGENLGFSGGNNLGAAAAAGDVLVFLNPDTQVMPGSIETLVQALDTHPEAGAVTPKIVLTAQPDIINTCGNEVHYTGFGYIRGWQQPATALNEATEVCAISGAAFAIRRSLYEALGGFDAIFSPAYGEDTDLSWRVRLAGYTCWHIPQAVICHDYRVDYTPTKFRWNERNRHQLLLKHLRWRTLLVLLPALLLAETVSWGYAVLSGWPYLRAKFENYGWLIAHWTPLMQSRRQSQHTRRLRDRDLLAWCTHQLAYGQVSGGLTAKVAQRLFDPCFRFWKQVALSVIRW